MKGDRVGLVLLRKRSAEMRGNDLENTSSDVSAIRYYMVSDLQRPRVARVLFLPVPIHQSSCSSQEYVFDPSFFTAVASFQDVIMS